MPKYAILFEAGNLRKIFLFVLLFAGIIGIVYSWPVFLLVILVILAAVLAWLYLPTILIVLPALVPFLPALNPSADIDLAAIRAIVMFLAVVGGVYIAYTKKSWFSLSTPTILVVFFLAWSFFSGFLADDPDRFLRKYLVFLTIFPIYFLTLAYLRKKEQWLKLFKYWVWSAFAVSLIGLGQFLFQFIGGQQLFFKFWGNYVAPILYGTNAGEAIASNPSWFVNISGATVLRAIGTFPDPHMLAFFLGMSLPLQVAYVLDCSRFSFSGSRSEPVRNSFYSGGGQTGRLAGRPRRNFIYWILPSFSFLALLLTFSRGSYVGLVGVVLWLAIYLWRNYPGKKQRRVPYGTRQRLAMGVLLVLIFSALLPPVRDRFTSILDVYEGSNKGRLEVWSEALGITLKNPVLGVGLGNYASAVRPEAKYREPIYAHNTYLDLSSEIGILGALAWMLIMVWGASPLVETRHAVFLRKDLNIYNLAASFGILWFSLHAFFETPLFSPQILPLILILVAFRVHAQFFVRSEK